MKAVVPSNNVQEPRKQSTRRKVRFEFVEPTAHGVRLVGSFNAWKVETGEMTPLDHGKWVKELELAPGTYEYRYVVDGTWVQDPKAEHSVTNPFGERNSLISVRARNGG